MSELTSAAPAPAFLSAAQPRWTRLPIRTRPHRNPLAENDDERPDCPAEVAAKLADMYPLVAADVASGEEAAAAKRRIEFADIGCAFGGMLFSLAPLFPDTLMLGLEIRSKVVQFAQDKAKELRANADPAQGHHHYNNVWFEQLNVMKFGANYFEKGQLSKMFFCYPDPHWKRKNIRRRIIGPGLVHEYAFWLKVGGLLYTVSDVPELEKWMIDCLDACPLFERLPDEEILADDFSKRIIDIVTSSSEDAQRTERKGLNKNFAVHRRIAAPASSVSLDLVDIVEVNDMDDNAKSAGRAAPPPPAAFQRASNAKQ